MPPKRSPAEELEANIRQLEEDESGQRIEEVPEADLEQEEEVILPDDQLEPEGEPEPDEVEVFGEKITKSEWEQRKKDSENIGRMAAAHTQRSQELASERDRIAARAREIERLEQVARQDPQAAMAMLTGQEPDDESAARVAYQRLVQRLDDLEASKKRESSKRAIEEIEGTIRREVRNNPVLQDFADDYVSSVRGALLSDRELSESNYQDRIRHHVSETADLQKRRDALRQRKIKEARAKGKRASVPRSAGGTAPKPRAARNEETPWAPGKKGLDVDWDAVDKKAVKYLQEMEAKEE
jgi:hypothetical protein